MDVVKISKENAALKRRITELESAVKEAHAFMEDLESSTGASWITDPLTFGLGADGTGLFYYVESKLRRALRKG